MYLASRSDSSPASAQDISQATNVSVGYLQKILRGLARGGILTAQRGSGGGFALAKVPSAISVLDVLRASDTPSARIETCPLGIKGHTRLCSLHRMLDNELARTESVFASTTIADLLEETDGISPLCDSGGRRPVSADLTVSKPAKANPKPKK